MTFTSFHNIIYPYFSILLLRKEAFIITNYLNLFFIIVLFLTIFICVFFIPVYTSGKNFHVGNLLWPAPGIYRINSYFGKRKAPANGASTYHKGIDIGAPENYDFIAVANGTITFTGFLGGGGYTITLTDSNTENGEIQYSYCHCNPNFTVNVGDFVEKGQIIGRVGPKYVDHVERKHLYRWFSVDTQMEPQHGPHLHFGMRINGKYVNPLNYLSYSN